MGKEIGVILEKDIPEFLVELGKTVLASGLCFEDWIKTEEEAFLKLAGSYLK